MVANNKVLVVFTIINSLALIISSSAIRIMEDIIRSKDNEENYNFMQDYYFEQADNDYDNYENNNLPPPTPENGDDDEYDYGGNLDDYNGIFNNKINKWVEMQMRKSKFLSSINPVVDKYENENYYDEIENNDRADEGKFQMARGISDKHSRCKEVIDGPHRTFHAISNKHKMDPVKLFPTEYYNISCQPIDTRVPHNNLADDVILICPSPKLPDGKNHCITVEKSIPVFKKNKTNCWKQIESIHVKTGCKCYQNYEQD